jgi:hypothetical protein
MLQEVLEQLTLPTLIVAGIIAAFGSAFAWCVRTLGKHTLKIVGGRIQAWGEARAVRRQAEFERLVCILSESPSRFHIGLLDVQAEATLSIGMRFAGFILVLVGALVARLDSLGGAAAMTQAAGMFLMVVSSFRMDDANRVRKALKEAGQRLDAVALLMRFDDSQQARTDE